MCVCVCIHTNINMLAPTCTGIISPKYIHRRPDELIASQ